LGAGACDGSPSLADEPTATSTVAGPTATFDLASVQPGGMERPDICLEPGEGSFSNERSAEDWYTPVLVLGDGPRGVVLGAQSNGGICQMVPYARELVEQGYRVAVFEWGQDHTDSMAMAVRAITRAGAQKIVVGGFSAGAVVGLGAAKDLGPTVVGVLAVSAGPSETDGYPSVASLGTYAGPVLLVGAEGDAVWEPGINESIARAHPGPETVLTVAGGEHALGLLRTHGPAVRAAITAFLTRVLGKGT
jgi:pimeloyl-ACP methyl ester carboxylesterase